jgi:hypothetical protein
MAKTINIGSVTKKDMVKTDRKISRELELENSTGWVSKRKVHKDKKKDAHRKRKHRGREF